MLFPENDPFWRDAVEFLNKHRNAEDVSVAPDEFSEKIPLVMAYDLTSASMPVDWNWVVVHKGLLPDIDRSFLVALCREIPPVFANEVFVIFAAQSTLPKPGRNSPHVWSLYEKIGQPGTSTTAAVFPVSRPPVRENAIAAPAQQPRSPIHVDVVIPCYNYGWCLNSCVTSVLSQAGVYVRVLIIDDASTDGSAQVALALAAADPRVECRVHAVNLGHIATYNEGLEWASGACIVFLDADDMLTPGSLQRACDLLEAHPEVGFVYGRPLIFRDDPPPVSDTRDGRQAIWSGSKWFELRCMQARNCIYSPEVVVRRNLLNQLGGFREELPHTADFELWMRLALYSDVGYVWGPHQAWYRNHPMGMHVRQFGTPLADLKQIWSAFQLLFQGHAARIHDCRNLEEAVRCRLSQRALQYARENSASDAPGHLAMVAGLEELAATIHSSM